MKSKLALHGGPRTVPDCLKKRWPEITQEDKDAVLAVLDRNVLTGVFGPEASGLERDWAAFTGSKHVLSFNSGTAAIHSALFAAGVGPGDEVITSAFSFSGSFHPILHQNALPVFVDIDPRTYNLDVKQIEAKITGRTKALLPVHIHGLPADMDEILALGQKYNLVVIEDACQAHGATYRGRNCGTIGAMACFSLNATKNLSGGEGGFVNTDDEEYWERAKMIRTFGEKIGAEKEKIRPYFSHTIGWNYRTQELPAAFARSQLQRLPRYNAIAQRNGQFLSAELSQIAGLIPPYIPDDRTTIYHKYRLRFDPQALGLTIPAVDFRNRLIDALEAEGVEATLWHVTPLPSFPVFQRLNEGYVQGTPWLPQVEPPQVKYIPEEYPEAQRLMDESIVVNSEPYPIFLQDQELMECYVAAFRKVFDNLDELAV
jgi:dTDP-4-amino-4,6-dideoxygalactose transaminase